MSDSNVLKQRRTDKGPPLPVSRRKNRMAGNNEVIKSPKHKMTKWDKSQALWGWIFILPTMTGLIILNIWPLIQSVYQTFFRTGDFGRGNVFVGLQNYERLFHDSEVWQALWNTFKHAFIVVPFSIFLGLVLAVLLNRKIVGRTFYRTVLYLPMIAAPAAVAMVWRWLYNTKFGLINNVLHTNIEWISNPSIAWISIGIIGVWSILGRTMILFLAGLQEIPQDYYEAAQVDGAGSIYEFFKITLPLLSPTIFFVMVTRIIGALQVFDLIYMVMDKSNPALPKTESIVYLFYQYSFVNHDNGYGSTIVVLLVVCVMILTAIQMKAQKKWVFYY